jgi:hypothetical protein
VVFNLGYAKTTYIIQNETQEKLEPALILALTKICHRIEVLACQKRLNHLINMSEPNS